MIRHAITEAALTQAIDAQVPGWRAKAKRRAAKIAEAGKFNEKSSIWTEVKSVYRSLQNHKCAFCERPLPSSVYGAIEHDVEHFRPKSSVQSWQSSAIPDAWHHAGRVSGYYWLAYDLMNYATSCKVCNSPLKGNRFPVAAQAPAVTPGDAPAVLNAAELPLLIFPLGDTDADPETLLRHDGLLVLPTETDDALHAHRRAVVTIAFFALNGREELWQGRAVTIKLVYEALARVANPQRPEDVEQGKEDAATYTSAGYPHAACARALARLFDTDPERAWTIYQAARRIDAELARGVHLAPNAVAV